MNLAIVDNLSGFDVAYWPIVRDTETSSSAYYCVPILTDRDGNSLIGDDVLLLGSKERVLDQATLAKNLQSMLNSVFRFLNKRQIAGETPRLIIPLNSAALSVESVSTVFADICREIDKEFSGQMVFEIFNFKDRLTIDQLDKIGILVFPFCRHYIARPSPGLTDFKVFANTNFQGVSFDLMNKPWPVDRIKPHLEKFCNSAEMNRLAPYINGVATKEVYDLTLDLGFKYLNGSGVQQAQQ